MRDNNKLKEASSFKEKSLLSRLLKLTKSAIVKQYSRYSNHISPISQTIVFTNPNTLYLYRALSRYCFKIIQTFILSNSSLHKYKNNSKHGHKRCEY